MKLTVILPTEVFYEGEVRKISARGLEGSFTILPRHNNYVSVLEPGILFFQPQEDEEIFMAIDEGVLVKKGDQVTIVTQNAIEGPHLGELHKQVQASFIDLDEHEQRARAALHRLEADLVRRFLDLRENRRG